MSDSDWIALRNVLVESYDDLARRLTRRLRSADLAREALQDTYVRLEHKRGSALGEVRNPLNFVLRIATNLALDKRRAEKRRASAVELDHVLEVADDAPSPAEVAEARSDLAALERALDKLPARRRAIFLAAWKENLSAEEIGRRYGLGKRAVNSELEVARGVCAAEIKKGRKK